MPFGSQWLRIKDRGCDLSDNENPSCLRAGAFRLRLADLPEMSPAPEAVIAIYKIEFPGAHGNGARRLGWFGRTTTHSVFLN